MTPLTTSPGLTSPPGMAFLTLARMTSPRYATRRFDPPSTWMHITSLAPVLSATSRYVYIWIMGVPHQAHPSRRVGLRLLLLLRRGRGACLAAGHRPLQVGER